MKSLRDSGRVQTRWQLLYLFTSYQLIGARDKSTVDWYPSTWRQGQVWQVAGRVVNKSLFFGLCWAFSYKLERGDFLWCFNWTLYVMILKSLISEEKLSTNLTSSRCRQMNWNHVLDATWKQQDVPTGSKIYDSSALARPRHDVLETSRF